MLSDLDARRQQRDHVTGVGAASLTLAAATVRRPAASLLDLGTGCGVQALHATRFAARVTGTDVAPRALAMARATFVLNELDVELLAGPWLDPVDGRRFDRIVSNPPFVPGPPRVDYVYRDSGQGGDAALAALLPDLAAHLQPGGVAQLLGSWLHVAGEDWPDRVVSWLPPGVDAWVLQREVADPALHVGTWQRDAGLDLAAPATREQAGAWLDWLARERVQAVGFGHLVLRRTEGAPTVVVEDLTGDLEDPLGPEVEGWLDRVDWLRAHGGDAELLAARLAVAPTVLLETYAQPGADGGPRSAPRWPAQDGPRWRHEVDGPAAALLAGCQGALPLGELFELLALAHDRPAGELVAASLPALRELIRHGVLVPATPRDRAVRAVAARVTRAAVRVDGAVVGEITEPGLLVLLGVHRDDPHRGGRRDGPQAARAADPGRRALLRRGRRAAAGGQPVHALRRHPQGPAPVLVGGRPGRSTRNPWSRPWWRRCAGAARPWPPASSAP